MEDLKKLIERIAQEDNMRFKDVNNVYKVNNVNSRYFISSRRNSSISSRCIKKQTYSNFNNEKKNDVTKNILDNRSSSTKCFTTITTTTTCTEETGGASGDCGEPQRKQFKQGASRTSKNGKVIEGICDSSDVCGEALGESDEHFNSIYSYWQDNLCSNNCLLR